HSKSFQSPLIQMKLSLTFCVTNGKDKYYFLKMQAGIIDMQPNVRRNRGCGAAELMSHEHE
ncbi:MAG TPA: hypothetical protein PLV82_04670, partial [bacterium]|nr:hypothetical protein [bacterium]